MLTRARCDGFTLVELMIGLAVIAIVVFVGLPTYAAWINNTKIRTAAESLSAALQLARTEAIRRNRSVQVALGTNSDWTVSVVSPAQVIQSRPSEQGSTGVAVTKLPAAATTVTFSSLGRVASNADGSASLTQADFAVPSTTTRSLRITVNTGGTVRMCDPSVTDSTDTRYCS